MLPPPCNLKMSPESGHSPQTLFSPAGRERWESVPWPAPGAMSSKVISPGGSLAFPKVMLAGL